MTKRMRNPLIKRMNLEKKGQLVRLPLFFGLWWILTEGDMRHLWFGAGAAGVATVASLILWPARAWHWSFAGFIRFWPYFLGQSFVGGLDVARRALAPSLPLQTAVIPFELSLRHPPAIAFLAWTIGLLPGTASVRLRDTVLEVHVLDERLPNVERLKKIEGKIAALFSINPPSGEQTPSL